MKRIYTLLLLILMVLLILFRVIRYRKYTNNLTLDEKIEKIMENMSIEEKIAQMLIIYYPSDKIDDNLIGLLKNTPPGGFIIGNSNITTYDKTLQYINDLKKYSDIPLIISINEEGSTIQQLSYLKDINPINIPDMYYIGKTNNTKLSYRVGKVLAQKLKTLGINVIYAPVVDINSNPNNIRLGTRSFGNNSKFVSNMALNLIDGLENNNVISTIKHFPGHGDTINTSNSPFPIINKTYNQIKNEELIPFEDAIEHNIKLIMVAHIALPSLTGNNTPASLSKEIVTDLLKTKMNYKGLIITDSLTRNNLINTYTEEQIYTMAINAGNDLLLMPQNYNNAIKYIKDNISEERIDESVRKILKFKYTYLIYNNTLDKSYLNNQEQQSIISQIPIK